MPAIRLARRRRSSLALGATESCPSPRNVTFAPNITPGTYMDDGGADDAPSEQPASFVDALFPPSETPAPAPSRRRAPPGKRLSEGYIPRPANAFMLFRADFVHQKHVPGSIETSHGSLSKIIGNCWHALPLEQKKVWEDMAKRAKAEHREMYPDYRFKPVHNKNKPKADKAGAPKRVEKAPPLSSPTEERRCEEVTQLLLEGMKGEELAQAVRMLDYERSRPRTESPIPDFFGASSSTSHIHMPTPLYARRRSSSRSYLGQRRASTAQPAPPRLSRSWTYPLMTSTTHTSSIEQWQLQRDWSPLPEPDMSLFEPSFLNAGSAALGCSSASSSQGGYANRPDLTLSISPLECYPSQSSAGPFSAISSSASSYSASYPSSQVDQMSMMDLGATWMESGPSSAFSGSPSPSETSLPIPALPMRQYDGWAQGQGSQYAAQGQHTPEEYAYPLEMCATAQHTGMAMGMDAGAGAGFPEYSQAMFSEPYHEVGGQYGFNDTAAVRGY
ncbi:hypothetical protein B0H21DRAFT_761696 [Amylocystis lapponica]|nr:hypothetical protein B0H21DRAFT_761696 [Amylocystis lapponica]